MLSYMKFRFLTGVALLVLALILIAAAQNTPPAAPKTSPAPANVAATPVAMQGVSVKATTVTVAAPNPQPVTSTPRPTPAPLTQEELDKLTFPPNSPKESSSVLAIHYNGYRRSQLEPCGCISKQLGGIDKEARLIQRTADLGIPVVKVDAGGFMKDMPNDNILMMTKHLLRALSAMKVDAINVGFMDLGGGVKYLKDIQTSLSLPFISANVVDQTSATLFEPYKIVTAKLKNGETVRVGIIGVTRPRVQAQPPQRASASELQWTTLAEMAKRDECREWIAFEPALPQEEVVHAMGGPAAPATAAETYRFTDPLEALQKYLPELREKTDFIVLLVYDTRDNATKLMNSIGPNSGIDLVVAGEYVALTGKSTDVQGAKLVTTGYEGKHAGLMIVEMDDKNVTATYDHMIEVLQSIPVIPGVTKFITEYKQDTSTLVAHKANQGSGTGKVSYAGAQACASCHAKEFAQWKTTKHAKAMATLISNNSQFNPDCLRCHTTGYMVDNGFKDFRITPQMGDVQCEVCHGPAFQHVIDKRREQIAVQMGKATPAPTSGTVALKMEFDEQFCSKCHDPENDNRFLFARDIDLVNHTRTEQRPADAPITRETSGTAARDMSSTGTAH